LDGLSFLLVLDLMISRQSLKHQCLLKCDAVCSPIPYTTSKVSKQTAAYTMTSEYNLELEDLRHTKAFVYSNQSVLGHIPVFSRLKFMGWDLGHSAPGYWNYKSCGILCCVDWYTRVGTLIVATIYLQLIQN